MRNLFVGIDIGCGGAKACIVDDQGALLGYGFREHAISVCNSTWSETDPDEYWSNVCAILQGIITTNGIDSSCIRAVSVSSSVPAIVMVDSNGKTINKAYNFLDTRAVDVIEDLKHKLDSDRYFALSAFSLGEQSITANILWEKANRPADYKRIHKVLSPDGYVTFRLTGKMVANYSIAPFFGMIFNITGREFDLAACEEVGVDPAFLPELYPCEKVIGQITRQASNLTGIPEGVPVIAGTCDAYAGWLAGGAIEAGDTQINLGTAAVLGVLLGSEPRFLQNFWNGIYPVESQKNYVLFGTTPTGGYVMRHLRNNFSRYERFVEQTSGYDAYELMNLDAERVAPGSDGLLTLPYFTGAHTPAHNPHASGLVFGWRMNHTKGHLIRSMMEGVAFSTRRQLQAIEEGGIKINGPIVMNEGGAKSRLWRRIYTDVLNRPTVMLNNRTGAPYGNAILAGVATGYLPGYSVARQWAEYSDYMEPEPKNHAVYNDLYELSLSVYNHVQHDYKYISELREKYGW